MLSLAEFKPSAGRIFVKPPQFCGLAEFKPKLLLSRPEIYSKPAWGSTSFIPPFPLFIPLLSLPLPSVPTVASSISSLSPSLCFHYLLPLPVFSASLPVFSVCLSSLPLFIPAYSNPPLHCLFPGGAGEVYKMCQYFAYIIFNQIKVFDNDIHSFIHSF